MKTKEEVIKEAWARCSLPKDLNQLTGCYWFRTKRSAVEHLKEEFDFVIWNLEECSIRPKSLRGIENNNDWIKIESEEDLPKDSFNYHAFCSNGSVMTFNDFEYYKKYIIPELKVTHYQPIVKPKPPIY